MDQEFKVSIYQDPCFDSLSVVIWSRRNGKTYMMAPVKLESMEVKDDSCVVTPTMRISGDLAPTFLKAFAEALDQRGVKTDSDAKLAGTLEATRIHLVDTQNMLQWATRYIDRAAEAR
jgi:hypothetical protein